MRNKQTKGEQLKCLLMVPKYGLWVLGLSVHLSATITITIIITISISVESPFGQGWVRARHGAPG
jgi:hypothetical protein